MRYDDIKIFLTYILVIISYIYFHIIDRYPWFWKTNFTWFLRSPYFIFLILGSVYQSANRVSTSIPPCSSQHVQRARNMGMVSANDIPSSSSESLRAKILRCFAKKYILLCLLCGGLCLTLGVLYLVIFFLLTRYTTSLHYFQTLPTYIPAVVVSIETIAEIKQTVYGNVMVFS